MSDLTAPAPSAGSDNHPDTAERSALGAPPTAAHLALAAALVVIGDFALFDVTPGAAAGLFSAALLISTAALNPCLLDRKTGKGLFMALLIGCAAIIEEPSFLAFSLGITGLAALAVNQNRDVTANAVHWLKASGAFLLEGLFRLPIDLLAMPRWARGTRWSKLLVSAGWVWFVPLSMSLLFLVLFASANPVLARWLGLLGDVDLGLPQAGQVVFWIMLSFFVWGFLRGAPDSGKATKGARPDTGTRDADLVAKELRKGLFSPAAVCRSLLLFNTVFALQNGLDIQYLWAHGTLPDGVTLADYAHAGTYPLGASALLAAGFVLLAFPSRVRANGSRSASALMYVWMAQTIFLVASAIARMALYIDAYALTFLRIAGLIVMALIAVGLILIALRIALHKSNVWLINANAIVLAVTIYAACFMNFDGMIADYNVANCREMGGNGVPLDVHYLESLGISALPALQRFATNPGTLGSPKAWHVKKASRELKQALAFRQENWRSWTYRGHRLQMEISEHS